MIASVRGTVAAIGADHAVIEAGGIGYLLYAPRPVLGQLPPIGEAAFLYAHLIVREDALTLYGFSEPAQRSMFEVLLSVSGVGPKVALSLLSVLNGDELRQAVAASDVARLAKVPGIGKKTAERLILELKGKLDLKGLPTSGTVIAPTSGVDADLIALLQSLGYNAAEASSAVAALPADAPTALEDRLRLALRYFGGM